MRLRNVPGAREVIAKSPMVVHEPEKIKGNWNKIFKNDHPLQIEIGMGKGKFLYEMAKKNPDINYVGIEKYSSVLLRALQRMEEDPVPNLLFIRMDAENIEQVFAREEVDRIYLNFSDPWPKDRHAKRRLTSKEYFARYDQVLDADGAVEFKTDNQSLFEFSLEEAELAGWKVIEKTLDLHHSELASKNVMTEYEEKFSLKGNPIFKMIVKRDGKIFG